MLNCVVEKQETIIVSHFRHVFERLITSLKELGAEKSFADLRSVLTRERWTEVCCFGFLETEVRSVNGNGSWQLVSRAGYPSHWRHRHNSEATLNDTLEG